MNMSNGHYCEEVPLTLAAFRLMASFALLSKIS